MLHKITTSLVPLYDTKIHTGFPTPVDDSIPSALNLNAHLVDRPASTFYLRVVGDSMINAGIRENDILVVDKSLEATNGKIVIAEVGGEFTLKRLKINRAGAASLVAKNDNYPPIKLDNDSRIWGVVTGVVRKL